MNTKDKQPEVSTPNHQAPTTTAAAPLEHMEQPFIPGMTIDMAPPVEDGISPWAYGALGASIGLGLAAVITRKHIDPLTSITYFSLCGLGGGVSAYYGPIFHNQVRQAANTAIRYT